MVKMPKVKREDVCTIEFKKNLYHHCMQIIEARIERATKSLTDAREAAEAETKSSVGDKYETGRAMMLMEMEKHVNYLAECSRLRQGFRQLDVYEQNHEINQGALVKTDRGVYYLAVSLGAVEVGEVKVFTVSPVSPIGEKLMGLKRSDRFELNGRQFIIEAIC
jgi:hypothetical protein